MSVGKGCTLEIQTLESFLFFISCIYIRLVFAGFNLGVMIKKDKTVT